MTLPRWVFFSSLCYAGALSYNNGLRGARRQLPHSSAGDFPLSLAPLGLKPIKGEYSIDFVDSDEIVPSGSGYDFSGYELNVGAKEQSMVEFRGIVSEWGKINVDSSDWSTLGIPDAAVELAFLYPPSNKEQFSGLNNWCAGLTDCDLSSTNSTLSNLIDYGAFVYRDAKKRAIRINTIEAQRDDIMTNAITFSVPKPLMASDAQDLIDDNRFANVTLDFMKEKGARYFCWLKPGSTLKSGKVMPFGAFVYLFNESKQPNPKQDVFFRMSASGTGTFGSNSGSSFSDSRVLSVAVGVTMVMTALLFVALWSRNNRKSRQQKAEVEQGAINAKATAIATQQSKRNRTTTGQWQGKPHKWFPEIAMVNHSHDQQRNSTNGPSNPTIITATDKTRDTVEGTETGTGIGSNRSSRRSSNRS